MSEPDVDQIREAVRARVAADRGPGILAGELQMNRNNINNFLKGVTPKGERWTKLRDWAAGKATAAAPPPAVQAIVSAGQLELSKWVVQYTTRVIEAHARSQVELLKAALPIQGESANYVARPRRLQRVAEGAPNLPHPVPLIQSEIKKHAAKTRGRKRSKPQAQSDHRRTGS